MSDNKEILYTETNNFKFRKDSSEAYYDVEIVNDNLDKIDKTIKDVETKTTNVQSDWNVTNTTSNAFIKNKPASLPANGGTADTIRNTLPINKGGTGAISVLNALKNLNLLNNTFNNVPSCSTLMYKNYTDFGLQSMNMFSFGGLMPDYSPIIFQTEKSSSAYITDIPTDNGIILFIRGSSNHRVALFFSTAHNNRGTIYQWSSNSAVLFQNWTKINDGGNASTLNNHNDTYFATTSQITTINNTLNTKVDKITGKGLSTNDFTAAYKTKLDGIQAGAEANVQGDWNITNTSSDAFIKNKPTSLPANGGTADTIKNTLPVNKGGTGAISVLNALKNLNLLNNTFNNVPSCSALVYKTYVDFNLNSMTMHGFLRLIPEYSFFIFENSKNASSYITDAPYTTGIIHAFKGHAHDCHALFFSAQGDNGSVYHYLANREVVLTNWTKINDGGNADTVDGKHANEFATSSQITTINNTLNNKVDKITGKGLSTNDFTAAYKNKLDNIQAGAETNIQSDWNVTDTNADAFIKNKPTSFPASGGNADTVDNKHADDFIQKYSPRTDLSADNMTTSGEYFIAGSGIGFPYDSGWLKVEAVYSGMYVKQTFTNTLLSANCTYQRVLTTYGPWSEWKKISDGGNADTVDGKHASDLQNYNNLTNKPTSFPASGGNADTVDGKHANEFAEASQITTINNTLNTKVDKITGKGLSTNDFTAIYKTKLDGIQEGAEINVQSDWNITYTGSDAFIKNKPTSLPANGGNADTVDGKHASDFSIGCNNYVEFEAEANNWYRVAYSYIGRGNGVLAISLQTIVHDYNSFAVLSMSLENNTNLQPAATDIKVLTKNVHWRVMTKLRIVSGRIQGYGDVDFLDIYTEKKGTLALRMSFMGSMLTPRNVEKVTATEENILKEIIF